MDEFIDAFSKPKNKPEVFNNESSSIDVKHEDKVRDEDDLIKTEIPTSVRQDDFK